MGRPGLSLRPRVRCEPGMGGGKPWGALVCCRGLSCRAGSLRSSPWALAGEVEGEPGTQCGPVKLCMHRRWSQVGRMDWI
jgi:hypothetical protein